MYTLRTRKQATQNTFPLLKTQQCCKFSRQGHIHISGTKSSDIRSVKITTASVQRFTVSTVTSSLPCVFVMQIVTALALHPECKIKPAGACSLVTGQSYLRLYCTAPPFTDPPVPYCSVRSSHKSLNPLHSLLFSLIYPIYYFYYYYLFMFYFLLPCLYSFSFTSAYLLLYFCLAHCNLFVLSSILCHFSSFALSFFIILTILIVFQIFFLLFPFSHPLFTHYFIHFHYILLFMFRVLIILYFPSPVIFVMYSISFISFVPHSFLFLSSPLLSHCASPISTIIRDCFIRRCLTVSSE